MNEEKESGLIAISKVLARSKDGMTMQEKKLCCIFLSKIAYKREGNEREIWIDKREIMEKLGSDIDSSHQSVYLRELSRSMVMHSELQFSGKDAEEWTDMLLFVTRKSTRGKLMLKLNDDAMPLLEGLQKDYITLFLGDILKFDPDIDGRRAYTLYEYLRLNSDTRKMCSHTFSVKDFKEMFGIPMEGKGSYIRSDGTLGRKPFEQKVIEPVLTILSRCEHVKLHEIVGEDGKRSFYRKIKNGNRVQGYELTYSVVMSGTPEARQRILEQKPEQTSEPKPRKTKKPVAQPVQTRFHNFEQRQYDFDALERRIHSAGAVSNSELDDSMIP